MTDEASRRFESLEVKIAFLEHGLAELDEVIRAVRDDLEVTRRELVALREQQASLLPEVIDEKPPHY